MSAASKAATFIHPGLTMRAFTSRHLVLFIGLFMTLSAHRTATASEIEKLLALPENKVDVGIVALTLAKEFYPNLDVAAYSSRIDLLAEKVSWLARGTQTLNKESGC